MYMYDGNKIGKFNRFHLKRFTKYKGIGSRISLEVNSQY